MKRKTRLLGVLLLLFFGGAGVVFYSRSEKEGSVESMTHLPSYGNDFPSEIRVERMNYSYFPGTKRLFATASISPGEFMKICNHFKVQPIPYPKGFQDGVVSDARYLPTNGFVYFAEKKMHSEGRLIVRLYLQPSEESRQAGGRLFIHVVN